LLPEPEWDALEKALDNPVYQKDPESFFECLKDVPVTTQGRRGSDYDINGVHYTVELWRKAKTVNRGRAVLACALAHLMALKQLTDEGFDALLEDNVRMPLASVADRLWQTMDAVTEREAATGSPCHMRYYGWLGSIPNVQWIYETHMSRDATVVPLPTPQDIEADLAQYKERQKETDVEKESGTSDTSAVNGTDESGKTEKEEKLQKPGGSNPVFGTYAYWISKDAYEAVMDVLRKDVGALLWRSKRMRYYQVKPIDKILPRQISAAFDGSAVLIPRAPAFFRAPMLTSKIHAQWDPAFCKSTEYQLQQTGLTWSGLRLTAVERTVVAHYEACGAWLTPAQLQDKNGIDEASPTACTV
jgi:hypothetical protein